ncbi:MAG: hypothetical protein AB7G39_03860 [Alphaproteobacteria bacterium]
MRLPSLVVAVFLGTLASAVAEERPTVNLAHVASIQATISQPSPDAINCGIQAKALLPALERELAEGGLVLAKDKADAVATLSLMTAHDPDRGVCATSALLGAYRRVAFYDEKAGWLSTGHVVLWQRATQVVSGRGDHARVAEETVARLAREMVQSWRTDNAELREKKPATASTR